VKPAHNPAIKSFKPKGNDNDDSGDDDNQGVNFHGKKLRYETHESTTDADAKLFRRGTNKEAKLSHMGHLLTESHNGLIVEAMVTQAGTSQEWEAGMLRTSSRHWMKRKDVVYGWVSK
jgi:hypothetical protein